MSLSELTAALRARGASAVELMEAVLARIEATNEDLNAVVSMHDPPQLLEAARAADVRILRGEARPLEGVPLGVKDVEDARGLATTHGSRVLKDNLAEEDCTHVARLCAAGAIVVGKTNTPEFGYTAITKNQLFGVTRSPWSLERTPGGSSGGASAALASGMLPLVTARDGGGSIRIPASCTGAFGLKPSFGRIPTGPRDRWTYDDTTVSGPLTKTVEDAALVLDQVVGSSPYDPKSLPHPGLSYRDAVAEPLPAGLRIAYSPDLGNAVVQSDIAEIVYDAVKVFEGLGHKVEEIQGGPPHLAREWGRLGAFEKAAELYLLLSEREEEFGRSFVRGIKTGWEMTPERFGEAEVLRMSLCRWVAELFEEYDLLLTPTLPYDPPPAKGPFPGETEGRPQPAAGIASFTIPFNLSWNPAGSVRAGLSRAGLPVGMQIVAPLHRDERVLQAARAFERERPWHPNWPTSW